MARSGTSYPPHKSLRKGEPQKRPGLRKLTVAEFDRNVWGLIDQLRGADRRDAVDAARLAAAPARRVAS